MANLIESLISGGVTRQDEARLTITRRPAPMRPRELLELFAGMGPSASFQGLKRSIELKSADPLNAVYSILGRWPTADEVAALPDPYEPWPHMVSLLSSAEFRSGVARRALDGFPERRRLLFVRIPTSHGKRVIATLDSKHPVLPLDLTDRRFDNHAVLAQTLGRVLGLMNISNALAMVQPRMTSFCDPPAEFGPDPRATGFYLPTAPARAGDLLFALIRDPAERALAYVNAACADIRRGTAEFPPPVRTALGLPRRIDAEQLAAVKWRDAARLLLLHALLRDPICHALAGDAGNAEAAFAAVRRVQVQLVHPEHFRIWGRTALDIIPAEAPPAPDPVLRAEDLTPADRDAIAAATQQDRIFYDRFVTVQKAIGLPAVRGQQLG